MKGTITSLRTGKINQHKEIRKIFNKTNAKKKKNWIRRETKQLGKRSNFSSSIGYHGNDTPCGSAASGYDRQLQRRNPNLKPIEVAVNATADKRRGNEAAAEGTRPRGGGHRGPAESRSLRCPPAAALRSGRDGEHLGRVGGDQSLRGQGDFHGPYLVLSLQGTDKGQKRRAWASSFSWASSFAWARRWPYGYPILKFGDLMANDKIANTNYI